MEDIIKGIGLLLEFQNILLILSGVLIGVLVGALPGLSSPMAIALLIPFTISLDPVAAIAMMAALYCAGTFGGSITAILINAPGAPPAVATALDGYPMAKNGEPGRALGLAAVSSVFGGIFSLIIFIFAAPLLAKLALEFGPAEYFGLAVFALSMLASMSGKSSLRNLISGLVGVLIGTIGIHLTTGVERFTFDIPDLEEGIHFVPVLIGLFAVSELFKQSEKLNAVVERIQAKALRLPSLFELKKLKYTILRSSGIGTFIGILPAEGSTVAAIIGYNEARRWSKDKDKFGKGSPEGIVGPEAANNAAAGGTGGIFSFAADTTAGTMTLDKVSVAVFTQALENIATLRAENGGSVSRLQFSKEDASAQRTNLEAANGRIMDVDIASESTRLAKYNILVQASASMLSQANATSNVAMMLLN